MPTPPTTTEMAQARQMAADAAWPPVLDGTGPDPQEIAAYLEGLTGETTVSLAQQYAAHMPAGRRLSDATLPELLAAIEAGQEAELEAS